MLHCTVRAMDVGGEGEQITPQVTGVVAGEVTAPDTAQVTAQVAACCKEQPQSAKTIMSALGMKHWKTFQANYLLPLIDAGLIERTIPDKPTSRLQKYRLTDKGRKVLEKQQSR